MHADIRAILADYVCYNIAIRLDIYGVLSAYLSEEDMISYDNGIISYNNGIMISCEYYKYYIYRKYEKHKFCYSIRHDGLTATINYKSDGLDLYYDLLNQQNIYISNYIRWYRLLIGDICTTYNMREIFDRLTHRLEYIRDKLKI